MEMKYIAARSGRLSSFLRGELHMSSGLVNRLKWGDSIRVNGISQHTDYAVVPGDIICVDITEEMPDYPAEHGLLEILYEDEWVLAVDKPMGMLIHPSRSRNTGTLANLVLGHYEDSGCIAAFHPLTRLDRDTYGAVLIAKNAHISALLQTSDLHKTYHAVTCGIPDPLSGVIEAPIARKPLPSLLREVDPLGKPCRTEYTVLEMQNGLARLSLRPITGRTHQLRVHCAWIGCPILGDPQYGTLESISYSGSLGITMQLLCARSLSLTHPITGQKLTIESKMDAAFPT